MKYTLEESRDWYNALPAKRSAVAMIVRHEDTVLMVKDDYKTALTFPGGVIDPEESPLTAALRETEEETGMAIPKELTRFFTVAYVSPINDFMDRYQFFFLADISRDIKAQARVVEGIEYNKWISISDIGESAGGRPTYVAVQEMLLSGVVHPYIEAPTKGVAPWQS